MNNKILIVSANYYKEISKNLELGAINIIKENGYEYEVINAPGCFEIPYLIKKNIDNFDGFPGVYTRYVYDTIGLAGVLRQMEGVDNRACTFRCVLGLLTESGEKQKFVGECSGTLINEMRGDEGFGYDPIFIPEGFDKTFAELASEEKNSISHRGKAMGKLIDFLLQ